MGLSKELRKSTCRNGPGGGRVASAPLHGMARPPSSCPVDAPSTDGDKVLGGPQAGLVAGRRELVERFARHPLYRALHSVAPKFGELFPYSYPFNLAGWPSVSVPADVGGAATPIGVQLAADQGSERMLLRLAAELEEAAPWPTKPPL